MQSLDTQLNPHQLEAVRQVGGPLLVLAGAGSGKTRVITYKIAYLVEECGFKPWQILAVTFTNKAAREMRERTQNLLEHAADDVMLGTFHSVCLRILRRYAEMVQRTRDFVIYDDDDRERLIARILKDMGVGKELLKPRTVGHYVDAQKHKLRGPDHSALPAHTHIDTLCARVYQAYEDAKRKANAFDFGDLIYYTVRLFENNETILSEYRYRWRYILVDEFQDTDQAQYRLLRLLAGDEANLCVVGDDDQSIYRWRGADVSNILNFPNDFEGREVAVVRLEQNYRSTGNILAAASALIAHNRERHDKVLWSEAKSGDRLSCYEADSETGEARWVMRQVNAAARQGRSLRRMVIFYRTHAQSRVFEDVLRTNSTPYVVVGGLKFYARKEVKDVLAYLRLVQNPRDDVALMRIINVPARGIGATTMERARKVAQANDSSHFEGLIQLAEEPEGKRARKAIGRFGELMQLLQQTAVDENDVFRVAESVLNETGYLTRLQQEGTHEAQTRKENIEELMLSIQEWRDRAPDRSLAAFLDHVSLLTSADEGEPDADAMTLMTVHAAKGLEFETVFVTGLEENVFPHFNAQDDESVEEERRLAYVAVTRGEKWVSLSWARTRQRFGRLDMNPPSRFIREIPADLRQMDSESNPSNRGSWMGGSRTSANAPKRPTGGFNWSGPTVAKPKARLGRNYDYNDAQSDPFDDAGTVGSTVQHPSFGEGRVARVDGSGPQARVTVQFPGVGTKVIVARFLDMGGI